MMINGNGVNTHSHSHMLSPSLTFDKQKINPMGSVSQLRNKFWYKQLLSADTLKKYRPSVSISA